MQNDNSRNTILFVVCSMMILGLYWVFVMQPQAAAKREQALAQAQQPAAEAAATSPGDAGAATGTGGVFITDRTQALATSTRVNIRTDHLQGSISLVGARIDDLFLTEYDQTLAEGSPPVELFRPSRMENAFGALFGWQSGDRQLALPGRESAWTLTEGSELTPTTPVTLTWDNNAGIRITRLISVDADYMFTVTDTVANYGAQPVTLAPYGRIERQGVPTGLTNNHIIHEGAIGAFGQEGRYSTESVKYKDWLKKPAQEWNSTGGWLGITDHYWLAALIPPQDENIQAAFRVSTQDSIDTLSTTMMGASRTLQPNQQVVETTRLFAGAKRSEILSRYESQLDLPRFVYAIDWGMFWFLTRPIFMVLEWFYGLIGNFGLAIMALTVLVKIILFPLANKAYESLSKMKTLQPKMEEIKKKHGDDPQKQQQEMMALYQREKINPLAGCLPILVQIPVFYALYKVLTVTIEMRHAPFFGWIQDLSARDPSNVWQLFGLIPWNPGDVPLVGGLIGASTAVGGFTLALGVLAIIYGFTMWLQQAMNPPAPDPMQRRIFGLMPIVFTFIMAPFAAGLLVYWIWNNILSILQQYFIMHRFKAENPIDTFLARFSKKTAE